MTRFSPQLIWSLCLWLAAVSVGQAQVLTAADQMPYFPGCDQLENGSNEKRHCSNQNLVTFIGDYLQYPEQAQAEEIEGTVYVSFVVKANGGIAQTEILRDIGGDCGAAALDILAKMPAWEPAIHEGKAVDVRLNLPIQFAFGRGEQDSDATYKIQWGLLKGDRVNRDALLNNYGQKVQVRDMYGNAIPLSELLFSFEKNRSYIDAKSNGRLTPELYKVVRRARKGGLFSIVATIQKDGEFVYVERSFEIID